MEKEYDLIVYIGRFQPPHIGHIKTIQHALDISKRVLVLVGSSNSPRTPKNPFTYKERATMIDMSVEDNSRLSIDSLPDNKYKMDKWIKTVQSKVYHYCLDYFTMDAKVALIGHEKDESSFYLNCFPQWEFIETGMHDEEVINATHIREVLYKGKSLKYLAAVVPKPVYSFMYNFITENTAWDELYEEWAFLENYDPTPFPRNEVTADAVVIQSGHILMIERGQLPGKGLLALPGGFVDPNETIEDAMIRELREETNLRVPPKVLKGSITKRQIFDDPGRSDRSRIITQAFLVHLKDDEELPRVSGGDDAAKAIWMPISQIAENPHLIYSDHWSIIEAMI